MRSITMVLSAAFLVAAAIPAYPGGGESSEVDLTTIMVTRDDGKPIPDYTKQKPGKRVITGFVLDGRTYEPGQQIINPDEIQHVIVGLHAMRDPTGTGNMDFVIEDLDKNCADCGPLRFRWVVAQAKRYLCPAAIVGAGTPVEKPDFCTDAEIKLEASEDVREGLRIEANHILDLPEGKHPVDKLVMSDAEKATLLRRIRARFSRADDIVVQSARILGATKADDARTQ